MAESARLHAVRRAVSRALVAGAIAAGAIGALALPVPAQDRKSANAAAPPDVESGQLRLRGVLKDLRLTEEQRRKLEAELEIIRNDRVRLNAALIETTSAVQAAETRLAELEGRLEASLKTEAAIRKSLNARRGVITEILAALQRMGRRPPPALLISPNDILRAVRTSMVLGSAVPELREETRILAADLAELIALKKRIAGERESLGGQARKLATERVRLASLVEARQKAMARTETALEKERRKAEELASQARTLKELIGRIESEIVAAREAAEAARRAEAERRARVAKGGQQDSRAVREALADRARLAPAVAFSQMKSLLKLPVSGEIHKNFGEKDQVGGLEKGVSIATAAEAVVSAPSDGWISFAGNYRTYGQLLIINAGEGYHIVLAGMQRTNVETGQFVLAGEPLGAMGDGSARTAASIAIGANKPILYIEFRKDGAVIDPDPWWSKTELKKVRG